MKIKKAHALQWLFESLEDQPTFLQKKMFGCEAAYLRGRLVLVLADGKEPWNGLLICTSREHHASLQKQFPSLKEHKILGKWLYLSQRDSDFENAASNIAILARSGDARIGVESRPRKRAKGNKKPEPKTQKRK